LSHFNKIGNDIFDAVINRHHKTIWSVFDNIGLMPRGRKKSLKFKIKSDSLKSVLGVIFLAASGLSLISLVTDNGSLLSIVHDIQLSVLGYGSIFLPFIFILISLLLFRFLKWKFVDFRVLFGLLIATLAISSLSSIFFSEEAGGFVGLNVSEMLRGSVTIFGGVLLLLCALLISAVLVFDVSFEQMFGFLSKTKDNFKTKFSFLPSFQKESSSVFPRGANIGNSSSEDEDSNGEVYERPKRKGPFLEVIPSASEPLDVRDGGSFNGRRSSPQNLPYTDKVWEYPPIELLSEPSSMAADRGDVNARKQVIEKTLASFGIKTRVAETNFGPAVTQYALEITSVTKIAKVTNLQNDIALALASPTGSVRIEAPIPGKSLIGIEVPNFSTAIVSFKGMVTSDIMKASKSKLTITLGHNVAGQPCIADISKMPHILIAGSTGSGKSVFLHSILFSLLYRCSPAECKFILVDPKRVELVNYNDIPHLLVPVITDVEKAPMAFKWAVSEMERRYKLFENAKVRNISAYNELSGFQALPYIVIIVDELAELMALAPGEMEKAICRLAQLSRATGVHLILSTQSPRVDVITGLIKANIPTRVAFSVASQIESRIIIDTIGSEKLLGKGDMLYVPPETSKPVRIQGVFISDKEINNLVTFLKGSGVRPEYKEEVVKPVAPKNSIMESSDELFEEAVKIVSASDRASASLLQRKLSIGYARAARLLDELEAKGIVGAADGSKPRDVLIRNPESMLTPAEEEI